MKRIVRQACLFLVLVIIVAIVRFPYDEYSDDIIAAAKNQSQAFGVYLDIEELHISFPGKLDFKNLSVLIPVRPAPVPVLVEQGSLDPSLFALLLLRGVFQGTFSAYDGELESRYTYSFFSGDSALTLRARDLALSAHPLLRTFGIGGTADLELNATLSQQAPVEGQTPRPRYRLDTANLRLTIDGGRYQGGHKVYGLVELPGVDDVRIVLETEMNQQKVTLNRFELLSSLGSAKGSGTLSVSADNKVKRANLNFSLKLTAEGFNAAGSYLALAARRPLDSAGRQWRIQVSKKANDKTPTIKVKPVSP